MSNDSILNRATGLLIIEVRNSNPNGDPDNEGEPRQRQDRRGVISGVSFKRKLRDLVEATDGPVWLALSEESKLDPKMFQILESRERKREEIKKLNREDFQARYWDARVFGNTFLESLKDELGGLTAEERKRELAKREHFIRTGVAQFALALSVAPVAIERMTNTGKAEVEEGKGRSMAPLAYRVVQHGVYCMPFFVNPTAAKRSGCQPGDIELLKRLIPYAYPHTASHVRPCVEIRHAWYVEHDSPLGSCSDFAILDALTPRKRENHSAPSVGWEEYEVPTGIGELEKCGVRCRDLMKK